MVNVSASLSLSLTNMVPIAIEFSVLLNVAPVLKVGASFSSVTLTVIS